VVRSVALETHGEGPDPGPESYDHGHLDDASARPGRHDPVYPRLNPGREHRPELPDAPPRLIGGPRRDLALGP
jgi:hypothetical protein